MGDEKTKQEQTEIEAVAAQDHKPAESDMVPKSRLAGVQTQASEWKAKSRELEKRLEQYESKEAKAEEERLKAASNWEALEAKLRGELEQAQTEIEQQRTSIKQAKVEQAFRDAGVTNQRELTGWVVEFNNSGSEDVEAFIEKAQAEEPTAFQPTTTPTPGRAPKAGNPETAPAANDLKSRLVSDDPQVRKAARIEQLEKIATGQLEPNWDQR